MSAPKASDTSMSMMYSFLIKGTKRKARLSLLVTSRTSSRTSSNYKLLLVVGCHKGYRKGTGVLMAT